MTLSNHDGVEKLVENEPKSQEPSTKELPNSYAQLAQENTKLKDILHEERLLWCIAFIVLFDSFFFIHMSHWGGPIAILILQIIVILLLSKRYNVEELYNLLDRLLHYWGSSRSSHKK